MKRAYGGVSTPAKPSYQKKAKAKTAARYKRFGAVPRPLVQYATGFPKQMNITHKYVQIKIPVYVGPNSNAVYEPFGVNCLYDPYLALGGQQPLYFDQMTEIYNHYTVMKSRITVSIVPNTIDPFVGGIYIDDDATPAVTHLTSIMEQPSATYKTSHRDVTAMTLYKSWDCRSVFGPNPLDNDRLQGNVAANPDEQQVFMIFIRPVLNTVETQEYQVVITMEFDTVWNELKSIASS